MVEAFLDPVAVDEDTLAFSAMEEVGPGGHFFGAAAHPVALPDGVPQADAVRLAELRDVGGGGLARRRPRRRTGSGRRCSRRTSRRRWTRPAARSSTRSSPAASTRAGSRRTTEVPLSLRRPVPSGPPPFSSANLSGTQLIAALRSGRPPGPRQMRTVRTRRLALRRGSEDEPRRRGAEGAPELRSARSPISRRGQDARALVVAHPEAVARADPDRAAVVPDAVDPVSNRASQTVGASSSTENSDSSTDGFGR